MEAPEKNNSSGVIASSISLWVLLAGHVFSGLFLRNLGAGLSQIDDPTATRIAEYMSGSFHLFIRYAPLPMIALVVIIQILIILRRPAQLGIDLIGALLTVRCLMQFLMLNLLLLSHLKAGGMLLLQLVLFIPVITINFGWLYWRIDSHARKHGRSHIRFDEEMGTLDPFDYFHIAANTLLQFEPAGAKPTSRLMKALFVVHGVMMLDIVALTLSRAISLATGG